MRIVLWLLIGALLGVALLPYLLFRQKYLPEGTSLRSPDFEFSNARLLIDRTSWNADQETYVRSHQIFDAILDEIDAADSFLIIDFFLWNPWCGATEASGDLRPLATQLADALLRKRIQNPDMPMLVITDPINRIYGNQAPEFFDRLAEAKIPIVYSDLSKLPDSNKVYAPQAWFWSKFLPAGDVENDARLIPNLFDAEGDKLTLPQLGRLLHFKANHRKVLIAGYKQTAPRLIIGSLNPADGSANHSNVAVRVDGSVAIYAAHSELQVAEWSSESPQQIQSGLSLEVANTIARIRSILPAASTLPSAPADGPTVAWRSEGAIYEELVLQLDQVGHGDRIDAAIFYFSDRKVVEACKGAIARGARVRILMDANRDAFGRKKIGIPNRIVASEFMELAVSGSIEVRWAATHGEQYNAKVLRILGETQDLLFLGSANWTRRNLSDLNLEANLLFQGSGDLGQMFDDYFDTIWTNGEGLLESLPYSDWAEDGWSLKLKTWMYYFQEWSGASTF